MKVNISKEVQDILNTYSQEVKETVKKETQAVAKESAQMLRGSSPAKSGRYARGWTTKQQGTASIVHNKTDYQLTHLLENGHAIVNQYGNYGRVEGITHIAPVEQWGIRELEARIRRDLQK
jgi:hypothetical protein